ncbi:MAG: DUF2855 family protein [Nevskiales bacterium]|nr:DUF2855 family protein [Nevskiales bacterium]
MPDKGLDFLVARKDLRQCKCVEAVPPETLEAGEVLLRVDRFAFSANNVSYAVFGEAMHYWDFFPAPTGWGRVPVWGFAQVARSRHPELHENERLYGYLPMSTFLVVRPDEIAPDRFTDAAAHRKPLPEAYQRYRRCAGDPAYRAEYENQQAILWPLYYTSFLAEDFLAENRLFGAKQALIASASSKTALGVAFLLKRRAGCEVVGLTSARNRTFCENVGYYDRVLTYEHVDSLNASVPTVFVDMAGEGRLLHAVHHHFHENMKYSCIIGATHWENRSTQHALPGAKLQFFFAPTRVVQRRKDWGIEGFERRYAEAWAAFLPSVNRWLKVIEGHGPAAIEAAYREVLEGKSRPELGHILSL